MVRPKTLILIASDDFVNKVMGERLMQVDCKVLGFCLEGYPRTEPQYKHLNEVLEIQPDLVLVLNCPEEVLMKRFKHYKYDPLTDRMYSEEEIKQITHVTVLNRLKELPNNSDEIIQKR